MLGADSETFADGIAQILLCLSFRCPLAHPTRQKETFRDENAVFILLDSYCELRTLKISPDGTEIIGLQWLGYAL